MDSNRDVCVANTMGGVAVDGTGIYVVGSDHAPGNWEGRIEKRELGELAVTVGEGSPNVPMTIDGVSYASGQLPKVFVWKIGSKHTFHVDPIIKEYV